MRAALALLSLLMLCSCTGIASAQNILAGSSFEVAGNAGHWGYPGSKFLPRDFDCTDSQHGRCSLKYPYISPYTFVDDGSDPPIPVPRFFSELYSQPYDAVAGQQYTFSAWIRCDSGCAENVSMQILDSQSDNSSVSVLHGNTVAMTPGWAQYAVTAPALTASVGGKYVMRIVFPGRPPTPPYPTTPFRFGLVDAASFAPGGLIPYVSPETVHMGMTIIKANNLYVDGESPIVRLDVSNTGATEYRSDVDVRVFDWFGEEVMTQGVHVCVKAGQAQGYSVGLTTPPRGHHRIVIEDQGTVMAEKIFTVVPPEKGVPFADSLYGADVANHIPQVYDAMRKAGMNWVRPHSEFRMTRTWNGDTYFPPTEMITLARSFGVEPYIFLYNWGAFDGNGDGTPDDLVGFGNLVTAMVTTHPNMYLRVGNEPYFITTEPLYLSLVTQARTSANAANPSTPIMAYAPNSTGGTFAGQLRAQTDVGSWHLYPTAGRVSGTDLFDEIANRYTWEGVPFVNTPTLQARWDDESGATGGPTFYHTKGDYDPDDNRWPQPGWEAKAWAHNVAQGTRRLYYWFHWPNVSAFEHTPGFSFSWTMHEYDGVLRANFGTTAASSFFLDGADISFEKFIYSGTAPENNVTAFHFSRAGVTTDNIVVAWVDTPGITVNLDNALLDADVNVYDMFGKQVASFSSGQPFTYPMSHDPHYIEIINKTPADVDSTYLQLGLVSTPNSYVISETIAQSGTQPNEDITVWVDTQEPVGSIYKVAQQIVADGSIFNFSVDALPHVSDVNTLFLLHFDRDAVNVDSSSYGHTVNLFNAPVYGDLNGKHAGGLLYDGQPFNRRAQVVNHPDMQNLDQFTLMFWTQVNAGSNRFKWISKGNLSPWTQPGDELLIYVRETGSEIKFNVRGNLAGTGIINRTRDSDIPYPRGDGLWHHLAFVFDGRPVAQEQRRIDIYMDGTNINGVLGCAGSPNEPSPTCPLPDDNGVGTDDIFVGGFVSGGSVQLLDGPMDEVVFLNVALSDSQIREHAQLPENTYFHRIDQVDVP